MAKRRLQSDEPQEDQPPVPEGARQPVDKLEQAQLKLARMEETNKIAFRYRTDLTKIEQELQKFNYNQAELDHILEPKGTKNIPGYSYSEMEAQKQYVNRLSTRTQRGESHTEAVQQEPQAGNGQALG